MKISYILIGIIFLMATIASGNAFATPMQNSYFMNLGNVKFIACKTENGKIHFGSGVIIGKNRIITANHVIYNAKKCMVDNHEVSIVSQYPEMDFAVLSVDLGENPAITPISCDGFKNGETYFSLGFSYAADFAMTKLKATENFMDAAEKPESYPFPTNHLQILSGLAFSGMSGGPIIDMDGRIVGITNMSNEGSMVASRSLDETPLCSALVQIKPAVSKSQFDKLDNFLKNLK